MKTKNILLFLLSLIFAVIANAQQGINYKAIINDANGKILANTAITVQFTILQNGTTSVYSETHTPTTDANGIIIVDIGEGTVINGDFNAIDWGSDPHYLNTDIDKGEGLVDMGTTEFKTVPYALHAKTVETEIPTVTTYSVGDFAQGGIVFWVDETGQHGLVCAKEDQSDGIRWYAGTNGTTHALGTGIYSGESNTTLIISAQLAIGDDFQPYAALICYNYVVTEDGIKYGDWYLPSVSELRIMQQNAWLINNIAEANGGSSLLAGTGFLSYWSSTEINNGEAFAFNLATFLGGEFDRTKRLSARVRAIRAF